MLCMIWSLSSEEKINILDVGCGTAQMWQPFLKNMPNVSLYGFDPGKASVLTANKNLKGLNAKICQGGIHNVQNLFTDINQFNFIVSHSVLEHVVPRNLYFETLDYRLTDNGVALISWGSDHFRQGIKTDIRNYISQLLTIIGIESYYAKEVDEIWALNAINKAGLEVNVLHYYSIVELKKLFKFISKESKNNIFQNWIEIEEEFNKSKNYNTQLKKKMDETFAVFTKKNKSI